MIRKLYVDLSVLGPGAGGVALYAVRLAQQMAMRFDCTVIAPEYLSNMFANCHRCTEPLYFKGSLIGRRPLWGRTLGMQLSRDAFVYAPHMRGLLRAPRQAITVHDLIAHYHPTRNVCENTYNKHILPLIVRRSKLVLTVSESSRTAISKFYDVPKERIAVAPNGIDLSRWKPSDVPTAGPKDEYLLVVSANRPYKNTLEVLQRHKLWSTRYRLKIVHSRARYGFELRKAVAELGLDKRVEFLDDLSEDELIECYQQASAIVYPSLIEGFGRPPLEGMAVGRPVILSDIPPHREIFSEAGIFVTPGQDETWRRAFQVLDSGDGAAERRSRGFRIAARHTWTACGDQLTNALLAAEPELATLLRAEQIVPEVPVRYSARSAGYPIAQMARPISEKP